MFLKNCFTKNFLTSNLKQKISNSLLSNLQASNFATKMRQGVTKNKKDSAGRRLGVKKYGGEEVRESQIIVRQRGFKWKPGENVHFGKDQTLHASKEGIIKFTQDPWSRRRRVFVHVVEQEIPNRKLNPPLPFMYHPELYPELAKKNIKTEPLKINREIRQNLKKEENQKKKEIKAMDKEMKVISQESGENLQIENSFASTVLQLAKQAGRVTSEDFTSKFEIEPILNEITEIGVKYFIPDFENQTDRYYETLRVAYNYQKNGENPFPPHLVPPLEQFFPGPKPKDITSVAAPYSLLSETYANYVNQDLINTPPALRDLLVEFKKEGKLNPRHDIRAIPYPPLKSKEMKLAGEYQLNLISKDLDNQITHFKNQIEKLASYTDEEVAQLLHEYNLGTKDDLVAFLSGRIESLERELKRNEAYSEKRKRELPGILKNSGIKIKAKAQSVDGKNKKSSSENKVDRKKAKIVKKIKH